MTDMPALYYGTSQPREFKIELRVLLHGLTHNLYVLLHFYSMMLWVIHSVSLKENVNIKILSEKVKVGSRTWNYIIFFLKLIAN